MLDLLHKSAQGEWLSAAERTFLKFLKGTIYTAILTALSAIVPLFDGVHEPNWHIVIFTLVVSLLMTLALTLDKYVTSHVSAPTIASLSSNVLANIVREEATKIAKQNDVALPSDEILSDQQTKPVDKTTASI